MRNLIITLSLLLLLLITTSCSSDDDVNSCAPIECLNGGLKTDDCGCDCPDGYTGSDCSSQLIPKSIRILRLNVKKFPNTKENGNLWDEVAIGSATNPDLQLDIRNSSDEIIYSSEVLDNRISSGNCDDENYFYPNTLIVGSEVTSPLDFILYDEDTTGWEILGGGADVVLYTSDNNFPNTLVLGECSGFGFIEIDVEYTW